MKLQNLTNIQQLVKSTSGVEVLIPPKAIVEVSNLLTWIFSKYVKEVETPFTEESSTTSFDQSTIAVWPINTFKNGKPATDEILINYPTSNALNFPPNFLGSVAKAGTSATASAVFTLAKNAVSVGSITFEENSDTGVFTSSGGTEVNFAVGSILTIVAPSSQDATLDDIGITLKANAIV